MQDWMYVAIVVAIIAVVFIYSHFTTAANKRKAASGEDKARFQEAVRKVMGEGNYTIAYAHHEDVQYYGRSTKTTYYHYALAFDDTRLWIMPLRFEKELILPDRPVLATSDMLGIISVTEWMNKKTGMVNHVATTLNDKNGKKLVDLTVDAENTKEDRFHHLNLLQDDECAQFYGFISAMSGQVEKDNSELPDRLKAEANAKKAKNAMIEAIIGIVLAPIGIGFVLGLCAIATAPKPKNNNGKWDLSLTLGIIATVLSVVMPFLAFPILSAIFS